MPAGELIAGLTLYPDWITAEEECELIARVGPAGPRAPGEYRNRTERYGPGVVATGYTEAHRFGMEIAPHLQAVSDRLVAIGGVPMPDAVTIGWYLEGQAMRAHVDSPKAGAVVSVLALAGAADMRFTPAGPDIRYSRLHDYEARDRAPVTVRVLPRMLVVMAGEVRWGWEHEILPVTEPRISIVFRQALP